MKLGEPILKILDKIYPPSEMIDLTFKGYDLRFKTNEKGQAVLLFLGKLTEKGTIKGERFARRLKELENGDVLKDHWENKGRTK